LAWLAQQWSDRCVDKYGNVPFDSQDIGFDKLGQNNWVGTAVGDQVDLTGVVGDWFSEIDYYNYDRNRCSSGKTCRDYKQVT